MDALLDNSETASVSGARKLASRPARGAVGSRKCSIDIGATSFG